MKGRNENLNFELWTNFRNR